MPVSAAELADRVDEDRTIVGGRFQRLPEAVRPEETTAVSLVDDGDAEALAERQALLRILLHGMDDG